jgi:simple sugar transport system permease protein
MSQTLEAGVEHPPASPDERVARRSALARLLTRPEVGALLGAIVIYLVFFSVAPPFRDADSLATILYVSSTYGIPTVAVALLMIGGEFDLSAGVAVTASALFASMFAFQFTTNMWLGVLLSLVFALVVGFINGYLVVKTGIPSFLVTLGTFFMLRGLNLAITKLITGNVGTNDVSNIQGFESARKVFASSFSIGGVSIRITVIWWIVFVAIATWVLLRTHTSATGSSPPAARRPARGPSESR